MIDAEGDGRWPDGGLERVTACPICGNETRSLLHRRLRDRIFFCAPGEWTLFRCTACGSGYLDPRPTRETIGIAYERYFTHQQNGDPVQELNSFRRVRLALANGYRNARFGLSRRPSARMGAWLAHLLPRQRANVEAQARHLPRPNPGATLLDVGCGDGSFLQFAVEMGWRGEGVEPDPQAAETARRRGLIVHQGTIECLRDRNEVYDAITLSHVIEHVHAPQNLLRDCLRLLKPGGFLWLETPNLESAGHRRYGEHWRGLEPPRHLVLFTWASLRLVLERAGFTGVIPRSGHSLAKPIFLASEAIRKGADPNLPAGAPFRVRFQAWRAELAAPHVAREFITVVARKPG